MKIHLDGKLVEKEEARVSVFDHGLLYGDGVFEGIRLYAGNVFKLEEHLERLEYSANAILLKLPVTRAALSAAVCETCRANGLTDGYIRLMVTRGVGSLGLSPQSCVRPSVIIIADRIALYPPEYYTKGLPIITAATRRIGPAALSPCIKSLNYLNNILAKIEAQQAGCHEALMLNDEGYVAECTGDNVFVRVQGRWYSPASYTGALKGITRDTVFALGERLGTPVTEKNLTRYDVWSAQECFLTGTAAEIIPVVQVDGRQIGTGQPGAETQAFLAAFREVAAREGTRI